MQITGTHVNYYFVCHRKLWLFANGIQMEHNSELVDEGRLIHETSYPRRAERYQEIALEGIKIDYYDPETQTVHEIKKTGKMEEAHEWQVKYYLYVLQRNGIENPKGLLEYPKLRQKKDLVLEEGDQEKIQEIEKDIQRIISLGNAPELNKKSICRKCSYYDFCWAGEKDANSGNQGHNHSSVSS
jgi:CRISPR-associated exonuclease Cas4